MQINPESGKIFLFFSGGTALRGLCRELTGITHNSIHIITPFDSGGSSAELRKAFRMPAVGDVRNRLMSLADRNATEPGILELLSHRLPGSAEENFLKEELIQMARGNHPLVSRINSPARKDVCEHLAAFCDFMPEIFDLRGASIGNLFLAAVYLNSGRDINAAIDKLSGMIHARGIVRPVVERDLHVAALLENGRTVIGQHRITGKEILPLDSAIKRFFLIKNIEEEIAQPVTAAAGDAVRDLIGRAELICYPMGSFYSSILANLLPAGIGRSISRNPCPKVFVPNTGFDPEAVGLGTADLVETLLSYLCADDPGHIVPRNVLDYVLMDESAQLASNEEHRIRSAGVRIVRKPMITPRSAPDIDGEKMASALLSLVEKP